MLKILIIDDSLVYRETMKKRLRAHLEKTCFFTATNGAEGLKIVKNETPDFILLDLLMPVMNGYTFLKEMRREDFKGTIIVITSDVQKPVQIEVKDLGARHFIKKPITPEKILLLAKLIKGERNNAKLPST